MITKAKQEMLDKAISIATEAHSHQFDMGGSPYILHALTVMFSVRQQGFDIETQCIAVLHDVMEDHPEWSVSRLLDAGMSKAVVDSLLLLCHDKDTDYFDYIRSMRHDIRALRVKLADIEHNCDIRRLKCLRQKDFQRLEKYSKAYVLIKELIDELKKEQRDVL